jgi:hypothetical protein
LNAGNFFCDPDRAEGARQVAVYALIKLLGDLHQTISFALPAQLRERHGES